LVGLSDSHIDIEEQHYEQAVDDVAGHVITYQQTYKFTTTTTTTTTTRQPVDSLSWMH